MTFSDVIQMWPSTSEFSRDVGVSVDLASKWRRERGIPSRYWEEVLRCAKKRGYKLTVENLLKAERAKARRAA